VKMTTSVAVVENGRVTFEPTEVTYRTIFYYLDATMAKMVEPAGNSAPAPIASVKNDDAGSQVKPTVANSKEVKPAANSGASANHAEGEKVAAALPLPTSSLDKLKLSAVQPVPADFRGAAVDTNKKVVVVSDNAPPPPRDLCLSQLLEACSMEWRLVYRRPPILRPLAECVRREWSRSK